VAEAAEPPKSRLQTLSDRVVHCSSCPRLVAWRQQAAADPPRAFAGERYWCRPLAGFGDAAAGVVVVGLAPAAHGGNRTGRMFTGDRSGDFLFAALWRAGLASQPESTRPGDGLALRGAYVTAAVRCAPPDNRPTPAERDRCLPYLAEELSLLPGAVVYLALGAFAYESLSRLPALSGALPRPRPRFAHGAEVRLALPPGGPQWLLCTYHPSQRNVFTGLLTAEMFDTVILRAVELSREGPASA
jgi:uracil-DNA glycosylase family 4